MASLSLKPGFGLSLRLPLLGLDSKRLFFAATLLRLLLLYLLKATLLLVLSLPLPLELLLLKAVSLGFFAALSFKSFFLFLPLPFEPIGLLTGSSLSSLALNVGHQCLIARLRGHLVLLEPFKVALEQGHCRLDLGYGLPDLALVHSTWIKVLFVF